LKTDGDARGGAALSIRKVLGVPIKFIGVGEHTENLEPFHPDRMASRILGMGDVLTLIEKAEAAASVEESEALARRLKKSELTLEDLADQLDTLKQFKQMRKMMKSMTRGGPGMRSGLFGAARSFRR